MEELGSIWFYQEVGFSQQSQNSFCVIVLPNNSTFCMIVMLYSFQSLCMTNSIVHCILEFSLVLKNHCVFVCVCVIEIIITLVLDLFLSINLSFFLPNILLLVVSDIIKPLRSIKIYENNPFHLHKMRLLVLFCPF